MKKTGFVLLVLFSLYGCRNKNIPDVSDINISLEAQRFEKDFFAIDTGDIYTSLLQLRQQYPIFLQDFLQNILELPPVTDTSLEVQYVIRRFINDYRPVKDSADKLISNFDKTENEIKQGLQFVKYYFPDYRVPEKIITFIGPMEGYSDVITSNALAIGLQLHLGKDYSLYNSEIGQSVFPTYISRRFTQETIPVNCMNNVINDIAPENTTGKALVELMVEKGKRLYVLDKIMPYTPDTLKIGYTASQLQGCRDNEGKIWNFFLVNSLVYTNEPDLINGYMGDAPHTPELGEGSPGAIGWFVGWQIVKKYMDMHKELSLYELLKTPPQKIFEESKYKPK